LGEIHENIKFQNYMYFFLAQEIYYKLYICILWVNVGVILLGLLCMGRGDIGLGEK